MQKKTTYQKKKIYIYKLPLSLANMPTNVLNIISKIRNWSQCEILLIEIISCHELNFVGRQFVYLGWRI